MSIMEIQLFSFRIFAILLTTLSFVYLGEKFFLALYFPAAVTHYLVSFFYSAKSEVKSTHKYDKLIILLVLTLIISTLLNTYIPLDLTLYFVVHSVLTDLYLFKLYNQKESQKLFKLRIALNIFGYLAIVHNHHLLVDYLNLDLLIGFSILAFISISIYCFLKKEKFPLIEIPLITFVCSLYFFNFQIQLYHLVFYHVSMWLVIPISKGIKAFIKPLLLQIIICIFLIKIEMWNYIDADTLHKNSWISFLGFFHITSSFFSSQLNPKYIISLKQLFMRNELILKKSS